VEILSLFTEKLELLIFDEGLISGGARPDQVTWLEAGCIKVK